MVGNKEEGRQVRFLMAVAIIIASCALLTLDMTTPHVQAASAPNCISAIPSPTQGTPVAAPTTPGTLFINEVLTNPNTAWNCADQSPSTKDVWIELYNAQSQPVDLTSLHISINIGASSNNTPNNSNVAPPSQTYNLPPGYTIAANAFLVLFPLAVVAAPYLSSVQLTVGSTIIDSVSVPTLLPDQSYARIPDGNANWQASNYPTIGASNRLAPPTPTPTPTKIPKSHVTRTKTPKARRVSSSSSRSYATTGSTSSNTSTSLANDSTQPSWYTLQFPGGTASPSPTPGTITPSSTPPPQSTDTSDLPRKIMISVSVIVLAFALLWCGKRFLSP